MTVLSRLSRSYIFVAVLFLCFNQAQAQTEETGSLEPAPLVQPSQLPRIEEPLLPKSRSPDKAEIKANWFQQLTTDLSAQPATKSSQINQVRWNVNYQGEWVSTKLKLQRKIAEGIDEVGTELLLHPTSSVSVGAGASSQSLRGPASPSSTYWTRPTVTGTLRWSW